MPGILDVNCYLTVDSRGSVRVTKGKPNSLRFDEVSVAVHISLPKDLFKKPTLSARLEIPQEAALPHEITAAVMTNVKDAIESASGMRVHITVGDEGEGVFVSDG